MKIVSNNNEEFRENTICRCNATENCKNIITIPADCNEFMIQCIQCGEYTNILKGLKAVQVSLHLNWIQITIAENLIAWF